MLYRQAGTEIPTVIIIQRTEFIIKYNQDYKVRIFWL